MLRRSTQRASGPRKFADFRMARHLQPSTSVTALMTKGRRVMLTTRHFPGTLVAVVALGAFAVSACGSAEGPNDIGSPNLGQETEQPPAAAQPPEEQVKEILD